MLRIGTDCSGIEAPIEALKQLGIPFEHKWACEIDRFARRSILANYQPEIIYEDITKRDHSELPDIDIYVCGFPCQSFRVFEYGMLCKELRYIHQIFLRSLTLRKNHRIYTFDEPKTKD